MLVTIAAATIAVAVAADRSGEELRTRWWAAAAVSPELLPVLLPRPLGGDHPFTLAYGGWSGTPSSFNATADALTALGIANGIGALEHDATLYPVRQRSASHHGRHRPEQPSCRLPSPHLAG